MKKVFFGIALGFILVGFMAATWNYPQKYQPIQFMNNVVFADTIGIDTASNLDVYGQFLQVDTLSDGRYYLTTGAGAASKADTSSVLWKEDGGGSNFIYQKDVANTVLIGGNSAFSTVHDLEVNGSTMKTVEDVETSASYTLGIGTSDLFNVTTSTVNDTIVAFDGTTSGRVFSITNTSPNNIYLRPSSFVANGQTLAIPSAATDLEIAPNDVVTILSLSVNDYIVLSYSDNS